MDVSLVKFQNLDGLFLDGIYYSSHNNRKAVLHVHGSFGNFYSNSFIGIMGPIYSNAGYNFLSFNLTQHDGIAEGVRAVDGVQEWVYIGYSLSNYDSCLSDISGAIRFLNQKGIYEIVLQGHSMGCNRILYYILQSNNKSPIILLSPTNSLELQRRWVYPETVAEQISRLKNNRNSKDILYREHGVRTGTGKTDGYQDDCPFIPITANVLISLFENPSMDILSYIRNSQPVSNRAFVYLGGNDDYQTEKTTDYIRWFNYFFSETVFLQIEHGNHSFAGYERDVANSIVDWMNNPNSVEGDI